MDCQDAARDRIRQDASESEKAKYRSDIEQCIVKCGDTHIALLPLMMRRIRETVQHK